MKKIETIELMENPNDISDWEHIRVCIGIQLDNGIILPFANPLARKLANKISQSILVDWCNVNWNGDINSPMVIK